LPEELPSIEETLITLSAALTVLASIQGSNPNSAAYAINYNLPKKNGPPPP
jgi:hypothetical protein